MNHNLHGRGKPLTLMHVALFLIVASIIGIVCFTRLNILLNERDEIGIETTATLVRFIEISDEDGTKYVAEFKYVVDGAIYYVKSYKENPEKLYNNNGLGHIENIKYNPENPEESFIVSESYNYSLVFIAVCVVFLLLGILLVFVFIAKNKDFIKMGKDLYDRGYY